MRPTILVTLALAALVAAPQAGAEAPPAPPFCGPAATTSQSNSTTAPIPSLAVTMSTIEVSGAGAYLTDVDLFTDIRHTWSADLDVTLRSPAGTIVTITTDNGRRIVDEFAGTTFDDQADPDGQIPYETNTGIVTDTLPAGNGVVTPLTPEEPLAAFHGENPNGTWTLTTSDDLAEDDGTLLSWRLDIQSLPTAPPATTTSHANTAVAAIPDPGVVTSTIDVAGAGTHLSDLDLDLDLPHEFTSDLDVTLQSPAGTIATITTDNGSGRRDVFAGTTFDDEADPDGQVPYETNTGVVSDTLPPISGGVVAPLTPEEPLAAFDGEDPNGTWTLTVADDDRLAAGELRSWRLDVTTAACPPPEKPPAGEKPAATGGPAAGTPPVAAAGSRLRVRADRLSVFSGAAARCRGASDACRVRVLARHRVIARGSAQSARVPLRLTSAGRALLTRSFGGVRAKVVARDGSRRARARTRAILAVERATTPPGAFVADSATLTPAGRRFVRALRARLVGVAHLRCDGFAALPDGPPQPDFAVELTRARAAAVCGDDARLVAHGSADPIATNALEAGRAANRRVVVTVRH